jgi:hypothetical protein
MVLYMQNDQKNFIKIIKNSIVSAKSKNNQRYYIWAISVLNDCMASALYIQKTYPKEYENLTGRIYEIIGDSYFAIKKYDLAFNCYLASYKTRKRSVTGKILFTAKTYSHCLSSKNSELGFLFIISKDNSFPGKEYSNKEFTNNIKNYISSLPYDFQVYGYLYFSRQSIGTSAFDQIDRQENILDSAISKYGLEFVNLAMNNIHSGTLPKSFINYINYRVLETNENFISSDALQISSSSIHLEYSDRPFDGKLPRLKCAEDYFWRNISSEILFRTINEDINFKFKFADFINTLFGHPSVLREITRRVGIYLDTCLPLDGGKFDKVFSDPINSDKVKSIYRKIPVK